MQIKIAELRQITDILFDHLDELEIESVDVDEDYYWIIPEEMLYMRSDPDPAQFGAGQLSDDWADVRRLLEEGRDPVAYEFVDLSAILRYIGERVVR